MWVLAEGVVETGQLLKMVLEMDFVVGVVPSWPRGVRHPTSAFGARVGALNAGVPSFELFDALSDALLG